MDSDDKEAFARHGNAFGKNFGGKNLSYRNFGAYEIAPPPELVWARNSGDDDDDFETEMDDIFSMEFEEEDYQGSMDSSPMMPWYALHIGTHLLHWSCLNESLIFHVR